jgi:hypothetical protein
MSALCIRMSDYLNNKCDGEWPSRGVAILFNIHQGVVIKEDTTDNDGRVLSCEIKKIQIN